MKNLHSKILKREDGSQVKIETCIYIRPFDGSKIVYEHTVHTREKGKRKWIHIPSQIDGSVNKEVSKVVQLSEIWEVQKEFWNSIKPGFPENHIVPCPVCKKPRGEDENGALICPCPHCGCEVPF